MDKFLALSKEQEILIEEKKKKRSLKNKENVKQEPLYLRDSHVLFPYKPYRNQIQLISTILEAMDSEKHALLESATGTGKSLSVLCAVGAWLKKHNKTSIPSIMQLHEEDESCSSTASTSTIHEVLDSCRNIVLLDHKRKMEKLENIVTDTLVSSDEGTSSISSVQPSCKEYEIVLADDSDDDFQPIKKKVRIDPEKKLCQSDLSVDQEVPPPKMVNKSLGDLHASNNISDSNSAVNDVKDLPFIPKEKQNKIYIGTRTHGQVTQLVRELRKTVYRPKMAVLASRKHTCIDSDLSDLLDIDAKCAELNTAPSKGCRYKNNVKRELKFCKPMFQPGGELEAWDIEDLKEIGHEHNFCPFYASRALAEEANLILCVYNYIIDPGIRETLGIDLENNYVIIDEAHNIEQALMEVASATFDMLVLEEEVLFQLRLLMNNDLVKVHEIVKAEHVNALIQFIGNLNGHFHRYYKDYHEMLPIRTNDNYARVMQQDEVKDTFRSLRIDWTTITMLSEAFYSMKESIGIDNAKCENEGRRKGPLTRSSMRMLHLIFRQLKMVFASSEKYFQDFRFVLEKFPKDSSTEEESRAWAHTFSIWCMNPAAVFAEIKEQVSSIMLTSGTLSPMESFKSELETDFPISVELDHVIDKQKQVWFGVLSSNGKIQFDTRYAKIDTISMQDSIGEALVEHCQVIEGGILVFFTSYSVMNKLISRWKITDHWVRLNKFHTLHIEEGRSGPEFNKKVQKYYDSIDLIDNSKKKGAIFFAVCRGKLSEGVDFSNHYARAVIVIGIPFPNVKDLRVQLKKQFNETRRKEDSAHLSGSKWYAFQAARSVNQALGRVIRHREDYGSILLIDHRFERSNQIELFSKWLRHSCHFFHSTKSSARSLEIFFRNIPSELKKII